VGHASNDQISGIAMDITRRKQAEQKVTSLNQQLLTAARQAGMADIATSILHNVGNILNSANVSLGILQETIQKPYLKKSVAAIELLKEHQDTMENYLTKDPKGQLIPKYFLAILGALKTEDETLTREISNLMTHLQHIREIIAMQQMFSGVFGITEKVFLPEIIDSALQMSGYPSFFKNIQVNKVYKKNPFVIIDKSKLLQILINLTRNAKDAVIENDKEIKKEITFFIDKSKSDHEIVLKVSDNGIGIAPENLTKIFSFGFTSKPNGHGVGLNSSAIAAKEMGGSLHAESKGIGQGAIFTLTIPKNQNREKDI
jgi:signal transduction histidine kinase